MTEFRTPPPGWYTFGTHAGPDPAPEMEFSPEVDEDGDPLWERPVKEDCAERLAEIMCRRVHPARFKHEGVTGWACEEHLADADLAVEWAMTSGLGDALAGVLFLHQPGEPYEAVRFERGPRGGLRREKYQRQDCLGENAGDEYPVQWPCATIGAILDAGVGIGLHTADGQQVDL